MVDKLILHAGMPKTGSTSLQLALEQCRAALADRGVTYPTTGPKLKHQWLLHGLVAQSDAAVKQNLQAALAQAGPHCPTVLLSTEGLFNHWWEISAAGRAVLSGLAKRYKVEVWVWFRSPMESCRSHYIQCLQNPPGSGACYGRDWSVDEMLDQPWFAKHLDYVAFILDVTAVVGPGAVLPFLYRGTTVRDAFEALGCGDVPFPELRENVSMGALGVDLLRCLNRRTLSVEQRLDAVAAILALDRKLGAAAGKFALEPQTMARVQALASKSIQLLERKFGIELNGSQGDRGSTAPGSIKPP